MPPKSTSDHVELKFRVSRQLLTELDSYWHDKRFSSRKHAIVNLLERALALPEDTTEGGEK